MVIITINANRDGSFSVNGRFFENKKEENRKRADELFNLLELQYPALFLPPSQPTVESEGIFYRHYPDTGSIIGIIEGDLYFADANGDIQNWGKVDYWFDYLKTEFIFDWLENQFPEILAPSSQLTVDAGEYFYRSYPDTNVMIASFQGDLYFIDNAGTIHNLGSINEWLIQAGYYTD